LGEKKREGGVLKEGRTNSIQYLEGGKKRKEKREEQLAKSTGPDEEKGKVGGSL